MNVKNGGNVIELPRVLDSISEWMIKNGIPLTRQNYIEFNCDLDAGSLATIPAYLREDEDGKPIPPRKKAKIISIRP